MVDDHDFHTYSDFPHYISIIQRHSFHWVGVMIFFQLCTLAISTEENNKRINLIHF